MGINIYVTSIYSGKGYKSHDAWLSGETFDDV